MDCVNFALDREKWQDAVNMVINLLVPQNYGVSRLIEEILASEEELCSKELVS